MSSTIPSVLRPQLVNNRWRKAALSLRRQADLRKKAISNHKFKAGAVLENGEWDPAWDRVTKAVVMREPKGKKFERKRAERVAAIEQALSTMDQKIKEMHQARIDAKPKSFLEGVLKKHGLIK